MNEFDVEQFERELQQLKPATPPQALVARMENGLSFTPVPRTPVLIRRVRANQWNPSLRRLLVWLAPASAVAALLVATLHVPRSTPHAIKHKPPGPTPSAEVVRADNVEIDQQLLVTFDTVAQLPDGEPIRFRCSEWLDDVVLSDSVRGILIQHHVPRLEIVPVGFETY